MEQQEPERCPDCGTRENMQPPVMEVFVLEQAFQGDTRYSLGGVYETRGAAEHAEEELKKEQGETLDASRVSKELIEQ